MENKTKIKLYCDILERTYSEKEFSKDSFEAEIKSAIKKFDKLTYRHTKDLRDYVEFMGECMMCTRGRYPNYKYLLNKDVCKKHIQELESSRRVGYRKVSKNDKLEVFNSIKDLLAMDGAMVTYDKLKAKGYKPSESWASRLSELTERYGLRVNITSAQTGVETTSRGKKVTKSCHVIMKDNEYVMRAALSAIGKQLRTEGVEVEFEEVELTPHTEKELTLEEKIQEKYNSLEGYPEEVRLKIAKELVRGEEKPEIIGDGVEEVLPLFKPEEELEIIGDGISEKAAKTVPDEPAKEEAAEIVVLTAFVSVDEAARIERTVGRENYTAWVGDSNVLVKAVLDNENLILLSDVFAGKELMKLEPAKDTTATEKLEKAKKVAEEKQRIAEERASINKQIEDLQFVLLELEEKEKECSL